MTFTAGGSQELPAVTILRRRQPAKAAASNERCDLYAGRRARFVRQSQEPSNIKSKTLLEFTIVREPGNGRTIVADNDRSGSGGFDQSGGGGFGDLDREAQNRSRGEFSSQRFQSFRAAALIALVAAEALRVIDLVVGDSVAAVALADLPDSAAVASAAEDFAAGVDANTQGP